MRLASFSFSSVTETAAEVHPSNLMKLVRLGILHRPPQLGCCPPTPPPASAWRQTTLGDQPSRFILRFTHVGTADTGGVESGGCMVSCRAGVAGKMPALPQECGFHKDNQLAGPSWQGSSLLSACRERGTSPLLGTSDEKPRGAMVKRMNAELRCSGNCANLVEVLSHSATLPRYLHKMGLVLASASWDDYGELR